jgi:hypothetical protein
MTVSVVKASKIGEFDDHLRGTVNVNVLETSNGKLYIGFGSDGFCWEGCVFDDDKNDIAPPEKSSIDVNRLLQKFVKGDE